MWNTNILFRVVKKDHRSNKNAENWLNLELRFLALKIVNHLEVLIITVVLMGT